MDLKLLGSFLCSILLLISVSCTGSPSSSSSSSSSVDNTSATMVADSLANPQTGLTADANEQNAAISGGQIALKSISSSPLMTKNIPSLVLSTNNGRCPVFTNGVLYGFSVETNSGYVDYYRTLSSYSFTNLISGFFGIMNETATNWYYATHDASSNSIAYSGNVWADIRTNLIQSLRHFKFTTINSTNILDNSTTKIINITNDMHITNINFNNSNSTAVLYGTRVHSVYHKSTLISGTWNINYGFNLNLTRQSDGIGGYYTGITGTVAFTNTANWTNLVNNKVRTPSETGTINFNCTNGTKTVQVTSDGATVTVDITTGQIN